MAIFRQYIAPLIIILVFVFTLVLVSARVFLSEDMAAPAPIENIGQTAIAADAIAELPPALSVLLRGLPDDPALLH